MVMEDLQITKKSLCSAQGRVFLFDADRHAEANVIHGLMYSSVTILSLFRIL